MALYLHWLRRDLRHHLPLYALWFLAAGACTWARLGICHWHKSTQNYLLDLLVRDVTVMSFLPWLLAAEIVGAVLLLKSDPPDGTDAWWKTRPPSPLCLWLVKLTLCVIGVIGIPLIWELVYAWIAGPVGGWSTAMAIMALPLWPALCISPLLPRLRGAFFLLLPLALATGTAVWYAAEFWSPRLKAAPDFVLLAWGLIAAGVFVSWLAWTRRGTFRNQIHCGMLLPAVVLLVLPAWSWIRNDDGFPRHPAPGVDAGAITAELTYPDVPQEPRGRDVMVRLTLRGLPPLAGLRLRGENVQLSDAHGPVTSGRDSEWNETIADAAGRAEFKIPVDRPVHPGPLRLSCAIRAVIYSATTVPVAEARDQIIALPDGNTGARMIVSETSGALSIRIPDDRSLLDKALLSLRPELALIHGPSGVRQPVVLSSFGGWRGDGRFLDFACGGGVDLWSLPDDELAGDLPGQVRAQWSAELTIRKLSGSVSIGVKGLPVILPMSWKHNTPARGRRFSSQATDALQAVTARILKNGKMEPVDLTEAGQALASADAAAGVAFCKLLKPSDWKWAAGMLALHGAFPAELHQELARHVPAGEMPGHRHRPDYPGGWNSSQPSIMPTVTGDRSLVDYMARQGAYGYYPYPEDSYRQWQDSSGVDELLFAALKQNHLWARGALLLHAYNRSVQQLMSRVSDCPEDQIQAAEWIRKNAARMRWDKGTGRMIVP